MVDGDFVEAYDWLRRQASRRVPGAVGCYPIWFWAQISRRDLLVTVRHMLRRQPGSVLVLCRVPRRRCLLSAYDDWHSVLNGSPLVPWPAGADPEDRDQFARWERRLDEAYDAFHARLDAVGATRQPVSGWPADFRCDIERGWEHVFDLDAYPAGEDWQPRSRSCVSRTSSRRCDRSGGRSRRCGKPRRRSGPRRAEEMLIDRLRRGSGDPRLTAGALGVKGARCARITA